MNPGQVIHKKKTFHRYTLFKKARQERKGSNPGKQVFG